MSRVDLRLASLVLLLGTAGCRDLERWSSGDGHYGGSVTSAEFVRAGVAAGTSVCLTFDASHVDDRPGTLTSSDGRFAATPLVPIRQVVHDPLSTLSFGADRAKTFLYAVRAAADGGPSDELAILSLMDSGDVELRLLAPSPAGARVFALFTLQKKTEPCPLGSR